MTISERDRRALLILAAAAAVAALLWFIPGNSGSTASVSSAAADIGLSQQQLVRMRRIAATVPARESAQKQTAADLADRERGIIQADTAPQAQAALLETARRIGKADQIDVRGGELGAPKTFGDYGLVYATVAFECHPEDLVNFLADLSREPEIIAPSEERIVAGIGKDKIISVRMLLAGVVPKKLVPEKKGLATF